MGRKYVVAERVYYFPKVNLSAKVSGTHSGLGVWTPCLKPIGYVMSIKFYQSCY